HPEQTALASRGHDRREIEKISTAHDPALDRPDPAALLHDELHTPVGWILNERNRIREPGGEDRRPQLAVGIDRGGHDNGRECDDAAKIGQWTSRQLRDFRLETYCAH